MVRPAIDQNREGTMERNKSFLTATEVAECLGVSKSKAYQIIRQLNDELKSQGYLTVAGKISRQYLEERVYGTVIETGRK